MTDGPNLDEESPEPPMVTGESTQQGLPLPLPDGDEDPTATDTVPASSSVSAPAVTTPASIASTIPTVASSPSFSEQLKQLTIDQLKDLRTAASAVIKVAEDHHISISPSGVGVIRASDLVDNRLPVEV